MLHSLDRWWEEGDFRASITYPVLTTPSLSQWMIYNSVLVLMESSVIGVGPWKWFLLSVTCLSGPLPALVSTNIKRHEKGRAE